MQRPRKSLHGQLVGKKGVAVGTGVGVGFAVQRHTPLTRDQVPLQGPEQAPPPPGGTVLKIGGIDVGTGIEGVGVGITIGPPPPGTQAPRIGVFGQLPPVQQVVAYLEPEAQLESDTVPVPPQGLPLRAGSQFEHGATPQLPFAVAHGRTTGAEQEIVGGLTL